MAEESVPFVHGEYDGVLMHRFFDMRVGVVDYKTKTSKLVKRLPLDDIYIRPEWDDDGCHLSIRQHNTSNVPEFELYKER